VKVGRNIIQATDEHIESVAALFDGYRVFYGQPSNVDAARQFIGERLQQRDSVILLAMKGLRADGFVQLYPSYSSVAMRRIWILNDLYVDADIRRTGVGRQLMDAAKSFALADNAKRLVLATAADNSIAQALYESLGYRRDSFFHYSLEL
jgi:ribosomal protein S18 acetylase RimI-like enzyme